MGLSVADQYTAIRAPQFFTDLRTKLQAVSVAMLTDSFTIEGEIITTVDSVFVSATFNGAGDVSIKVGQDDNLQPLYSWTAPEGWVAVFPPANTSAPTISGTAQVGQALSAGSGTWSNSPTAYAYQWQTSADDITWTNIAGATSGTYTVVTGDVGHYLRVEVTASNSAGSSAPVASSATAAVIA